MEFSQEDQLIKDLFLAVEATFFGHVTDAATGVVVKRTPIEEHLARIGAEHAQRDAHRRGFTGAVGTDEAVHLAVADGEVHSVEGLDVAEALVKVLNLKRSHPTKTSKGFDIAQGGFTMNS